MRAFLALNLPNQVTDCLKDIQDSIKETNRGKGTWTSIENMHLTLAFLGEITKSQEEILQRLLSQRIPKHNQFSLSLGHMGFFQDESSATLWCSLNPSNELKSLVSEICTTVRDAGIQQDSKPFRAHITLGRKTDLTNVKLSDFKVPDLRIPVSSVTIYKSVLTPNGPVYTALASIPLENNEKTVQAISRT